MKRFQAAMIGVFLGSLLACPMTLLIILTHRQQLSGSWSEILLNTIANGMAGGFLAGFLRGPVTNSKPIELGQGPTKRFPAGLVFLPQLGFLIGGVLAAGAQIVMTLHTDLVSSLISNPALAWTTMLHQGVADLVGRMIAGAIGGAFISGWVGAVFPLLNVTDDDATVQLQDFTTSRREVIQSVSVDQAELPTGKPTTAQANLPIKKLSEIRKLPGNDANTLHEIVQIALAHADANDYAGVVKLLEPACSAYPNVLDVTLNLANAYAELGQSSKADEQYRRTIAIDPNLFISHYNYGCFLRDTGAMEQAVLEFRESAALNPAHVNSWLNLADLASSPHEAIEYLEKARAMGCRDEDLNESLTMWRRIRDDEINLPEQRVVWAEQALLKKDLPVLRHELALARSMGLSSELQARAFSVEAEIERQQENFSASIALLLRAIEFNPKLTSYWNTLAAREFLLAQQLLHTTSQTAPNDKTRREVTDLLEKSIEHAKAAIEIGNYAMPNQNAAMACLHLGRLAEARNYALAAQVLAKKAVAQQHECFGCPMSGTIELECRSCLIKTEGTLRDIQMTTGDYQVSESQVIQMGPAPAGRTNRAKRPSQAWAEACNPIMEQIHRAALLQARAAGIDSLIHEATRLNEQHQLLTKTRDWPAFGGIALQLTAGYLPDLGYSITYALRELDPPLKYDPVPLIFTALQNMHHMRMSVITRTAHHFPQGEVFWDSSARVHAAASLIAREISVAQFHYARAILGQLDATMHRSVIEQMERFNPHGLTLLFQSESFNSPKT
jgi:tetratricopeptide (TPR) repeat protein